MFTVIYKRIICLLTRNSRNSAVWACKKSFYDNNLHICNYFRQKKLLEILSVNSIQSFNILNWHLFSREFSSVTMSNETEVIYLDVPDKSENDKKIYKNFVLPNGLRALIVSDPSPMPHDGLTSSSYDSMDDSCAEESSTGEEDDDAHSSRTTSGSDNESDSEEGDEKLAAVALLVDVGSFSEPINYQGLAHFLEHMIFMGSSKYPTENAFDAHIKKCGGFDNANTEGEETIFYFEVSEQHLDSSMDYFTALFKSPLMLKDAMTRERQAVESEFQQTLLDDEARRDQLLASLAKDGYPHNTFTWGNLKTLRDNVNDDELHKMLHEFCKHHYSAHRMYVCVQARLPIDELEHLVIKHFSDIPSNQLNGNDFSNFNYRDAFTEEFHKDVFFVKPVESVCKLELTWVLPPMAKLYKCKPEQFLSHLIGYEGEGSLCAYLRKKLWGLELIAGVGESGFDNNVIYSLFNICIYLTDSGFHHLDEVLTATFAYIKLFANSSSLREAFDELQNIELSSFRFISQKAAFDNVQDLVISSKYYEPKHILTGSELYFEYNENEIEMIIKHLNEFKFNIMIISQEPYDNIVYDKKEVWFGTEYTTKPMPEKWLNLWENSKPISELFLPKPNPFISQDFRIFWELNCKPEISLYPKKILQTDICELWFRQDDKFLLPNAHMYFYFISPLPHQSAKNDVMCNLYANLIKYRLWGDLYPATVAGLNSQFYADDKGIILKVIGYNEKLHLLVDMITKAMVTMREHVTEELLEVYKTQQRKIYFNALIKPKTLCKDICLCIIENIRWPLIEKYKILDEITLDDMLNFIEQFINELYIQTLIQGNLTEELAHNVMNAVLTTWNCNSIKERKYIENRTVQLPIGKNYIRCHTVLNKDINTIVTNIYQIGPCTVRLESLLELLMMFVEEPLFDSLRTKQQLGYNVYSTIRITNGIISYLIAVNSQETRHSSYHVDNCIEEFRNNIIELINNINDDEFEHVRESLIKIKQVVDISLNDEVHRNWNEIINEDYLFDRKRREIDILRNLTKQDIIDFCLNNEQNNFRKLSVQVIGHSDSLLLSLIDNQTIQSQSIDINNFNKINDINISSLNNINYNHNNENIETIETVNTVMDEQLNSLLNKIDNNLFNTIAKNLDVKFLKSIDHNDINTITSINDFKANLYVYPVMKTKLDDTPIIDMNDQTTSKKPSNEIIITDNDNQ